MGYEVEENILELYAKHMLIKPVDPDEERFGTYAEKSLKLHQKFKKSMIQKKVWKEVEALAKRMGITKEAIWKEKEENILFEEQIVKVEKKAKLEAYTPKPRKSRSVSPSPDSQKPSRKPDSKPKPLFKTFGGAEKKRKTIKFVTVDDEETKSDEVVKEVKAKASKATKIVNEVVKNGSLKPLSKWYENFDVSGKITLEEATYEINSAKGQDDTHLEAQKMASQVEQKMDDTSIPKVQIVEKVQVSVQEEVRAEDVVDKGEEDARKEDEGKKKDDNPSVDAVNPRVLEKEADTEKNGEKEKVEVKVVVEIEAKDTVEIVK
ncbi:uncharacterized protein LOC131858953 [Cryptomeria japonica]|uniref:uncharacterized protein LOC131858953 n=1 Tax=Cryptomeria japonica TaxID=3369 RepID=UPI0027DA0163|nr:uncharacterized protein LOC131858953 [Cryptomeria japonica]